MGPDLFSGIWTSPPRVHLHPLLYIRGLRRPLLRYIMVLAMIELMMQVVLEAMGSEDLAFALDLLDEYQSLLLEFLYADLGIVYCLMVLWGAQILSSWWP